MMKKNTDFKEAYKGPFEDFGYYKVFTSEGSMAFDFIQPQNKDLDSISLSEESREIILAILNGNSTIPFPYEFKYEKEYVWIKIEENWFKIILLRGWGHLTGVGGLHLPPDVAAKIQDEFGEWIAKTLNNKNDSIQNYLYCNYVAISNILRNVSPSFVWSNKVYKPKNYYVKVSYSILLLDCRPKEL